MKARKVRETTEFERMIFSFLDDVQFSKQINMFGAVPYIVEQYGCNKNDARRLLSLWMKNAGEENDWKFIEDKEMSWIYGNHDMTEDYQCAFCDKQMSKADFEFCDICDECRENHG